MYIEKRDKAQTNFDHRSQQPQTPKLTTRRQLKRTISGSNESKRQSPSRPKQPSPAFQNFFVKMPYPPNQLSSNTLPTLSTHNLCLDLDNNSSSDTITTTYKRSVTPYRTAKEKEEYEKKRKLDGNSEGEIKDRMEVIRLEEQCEQYRKEVGGLRDENRRLREGRDKDKRYIEQLEGVVCRGELGSRSSASVSEATHHQSFSITKKLESLKKTIKETSLSEVEHQLQNSVNECLELHKANKVLKEQIEETRQDLEFKKLIIRNYEHAASLPTARQQMLSQEIACLKSQIVKIRNQSQRRFDEQIQKLKQVIMRYQVEVSRLNIKLHCRDHKANKQLEDLRRLKDIEIAINKERFHKFLVDYQKFRRIHNELKMELSQTKRSSRFFIRDTSERESFSLELSPQ